MAESKLKLGRVVFHRQTGMRAIVTALRPTRISVRYANGKSGHPLRGNRRLSSPALRNRRSPERIEADALGISLNVYKRLSSQERIAFARQTHKPLEA